ncbi:MAG: orotate phosphoribosyltransferase [Sedimentisphaerales bacterium]|nr:orotate phosphoribosyltransferase [Sedimentisphaerales bacterium]
MQQYQMDFIEFLVRSEVLTFGDFVTKSGRETPYFINTGRYRMGNQLAQLGRFYAEAILRCFGPDVDNLYGPAYKGIPLAVTTAIAMGSEHKLDVSVTYNRKEIKDHGEKGVLIGHQYNGSEQVIIIEDVITAGTSVRETLELLKKQGNPQVKGVIVSVDRMERGQGKLSAIQEMKEQFSLPVYSIVTVRDIIAHLYNHPLDGQTYINDDMKARIEGYLNQYGI